MNRLQERYTNEITKNLMKKFGYESTMQIPKMEKNRYLISVLVMQSTILNS